MIGHRTKAQLLRICPHQVPILIFASGVLEGLHVEYFESGGSCKSFRLLIMRKRLTTFRTMKQQDIGTRMLPLSFL